MTSRDERVLGGRDIRLDLIRALAIALVFAAHLPSSPPSQGRMLHVVSYWATRGGWAGLDLFFSLSGYLIAGLLFREFQKTGTISIWRFYVRRGFKIYPALWVVIVVTLVAWSAAGRAIAPSAVASSLFFYTNYVDGLWPHLWSLAVEEHFYIVLPLLLMLTHPRAARTPWRFLPLAVGSLVVACTLGRVLVYKAHPDDWWRIQLPTQLRADALALGVLLAWIDAFRPDVLRVLTPLARKLLLAVGALILVNAFAWDFDEVPRFVPYGYIAYAFAGTLFIVGSSALDLRSNTLARAIAFFGSRSYSLYLWHVPVFALVAWRLGGTHSWFVLVAASVALAIVVGLASAELIEIPALALRDRLFKGAGPSSGP